MERKIGTNGLGIFVPTAFLFQIKAFQSPSPKSKVSKEQTTIKIDMILMK